MPAADCTCISQRKRKQLIPESFLLCRRPLRSQGKTQFCQRGHTVLEPPSQPMAHVHQENLCSESAQLWPLRMPLALRKGPVNQSWRDRIEKLRPGPDSRGSRKWIHLLEHMAKGTWNVWRVSHQVHGAGQQSPAHRLMGDYWEIKLYGMVYIPANRNYFQISFCFILSIACFPFINADDWTLTIIHYVLFYFIIHQTY